MGKSFGTRRALSKAQIAVITVAGFVGVSMALLMAVSMISHMPAKDSEQIAKDAPAPFASEIVGIRLGEKQETQECASEMQGKYSVYTLPYGPKPCWLTKGPPDQGDAEFKLMIAAPDGVQPEATVMSENGVIEEVFIQTDGPEAQESVYSQLVAKYGKPDSTNVDDKQNAFGARYQSIEARWISPAMYLAFVGVSGPKSGWIHAMTPHRAEAYDKKRNRNTF